MINTKIIRTLRNDIFMNFGIPVDQLAQCH